MSLSVGPVSNLSFRAQEATPQNVEDILSRPGAFAKPEVPETQPVKKNNHTFLKVLAGTLIAAGIIAGGLHYLPKKFPDVFKITENIGQIKDFMPKLKAYVTTGIAKGGEYVDAGAGAIAEYATKGWEALKGLFKSKNA